MPTADREDEAHHEAHDMLTFLLAARGLARGLRDHKTHEQLADCIERVAESWGLGDPVALLEPLAAEALH